MNQRTEVIALHATVIREKKKPRKWKWNLTLLSLGAALPVIVLILWQYWGHIGVINTFFLPTPYTIAGTFWELTASGELLHHLGISLRRAAFGFLIGGGSGFLLGVASGFSRKTEQIIDPSLQLLRMTPSLAISPLFILWFGFGETSKLIIIAFGAFFPLYLNTFLGFRSADNKLIEVTRILQFSRWRQITKLILPASLPNILLGVRISMQWAWLSLVIAELIGSSSGIGYLISFAGQNSRTDIIFVGIVVFAIMGKVMDSIVRFGDKKWLAWRDNYQG